MDLSVNLGVFYCTRRQNTSLINKHFPSWCLLLYRKCEVMDVVVPRVVMDP